MNRLHAAWCLGAMLAIAPPRPAFAEGRTLQKDPFARPALSDLQQRSARRPAGGARAVAQPAPKLNLQAVMAAGESSIANVDGVMVRLGDTIQGYRLVAVHDRAATFEKNNAQFTLTVRSREAK
jgi:hypothetical protein